MSEGTLGDMTELGITESFQVKRQMLLSASEAAEMILRVDNIIKAAPRSVQRRSQRSSLSYRHRVSFLWLTQRLFAGSGSPTITPARGRRRRAAG